MQVCHITGGAGTGKTSLMLDLMVKAIEAGGYTPLSVGFVSFTRAAREEAAQRAGGRFGVDPKKLTEVGYFRTAHAICFSHLGVKQKQVLADDEKSRKWLREVAAVDVGGERVQLALDLWGCARSRVESLDDAHATAARLSTKTPALTFCRETCEKYEQAKWEHDRVDFVDLLARYAGWKFNPEKAPRESRPDGEDVAGVPVWFVDEHQDASRLLDLAVRRMVQHARWVYVAGDQFQSIYSFNGASPCWFRGWRDESQKQHVQPKSHRCPAPVHRLAELVLEGCSDYEDRGIRPADHPGRVEVCPWENFPRINPREDWLCIARTNTLADKLGQKLDELGIPYLATDGVKSSRWDAPVRNKDVELLWYLEEHEHPVVTAEQWMRLVRRVRSKTPDGRVHLEHGVKKAWEALPAGVEIYDLADFAKLRAEWGAGPDFEHACRAGLWHEWITPPSAVAEFKKAVLKWGREAVFTPRVKTGTIHSVKGAEATNVLLFTSLTQQVAKSKTASPEVRDEEKRIEYVAVTRARERLVVLVDSRTPAGRRMQRLENLAKQVAQEGCS